MSRSLHNAADECERIISRSTDEPVEEAGSLSIELALMDLHEDQLLRPGCSGVDHSVWGLGGEASDSSDTDEGRKNGGDGLSDAGVVGVVASGWILIVEGEDNFGAKFYERLLKGGVQLLAGGYSTIWEAEELDFGRTPLACGLRLLRTAYAPIFGGVFKGVIAFIAVGHHNQGKYGAGSFELGKGGAEIELGVVRVGGDDGNADASGKLRGDIELLDHDARGRFRKED